MDRPCTRRVALALLLCAHAGVAGARCIPITQIGVPIVETFDSLSTTGSANVFSMFGWSLNDSWQYGWIEDGRYRASDGSSGATAMYSYGAPGSSDRALGTLGNAGPGEMQSAGVCYFNHTGVPITALRFAYTGERWRENWNIPAALQFHFTTTHYNVVPRADSRFEALDFSLPSSTDAPGARNGNASPHRARIMATLAPLQLPPGGTIQVRWEPSSGAQGLAIDDLEVIAEGPQDTGLPRLTMHDGRLSEGDAHLPLVLPIELDRPAGPGGATVEYFTQDGLARDEFPDRDYQSKSGVLHIPEGDTHAALHFQIFNDGAVEPDEMFLVKLRNPEGVVFVRAHADGLIVDNDASVLPISSVQGNGPRSPWEGRAVVTHGVITAKSSAGYYLQTPDGEDDGDPGTSEGIFFQGESSPSNMPVGQYVRASGRVIESSGANGTNRPTRTTVSGSLRVAWPPRPMPSPVVIAPGDITGLEAPAFWSRYESMRVSLDDLAVTTPMARGRAGVAPATLPRPMREPGLSPWQSVPADASATDLPVWDFNPEALVVDRQLFPYVVPDLTVGCRFVGPSLAGPLDLDPVTSRFVVLVDRDPVIDCPAIAPRAVDLPDPDEVSVANVVAGRLSNGATPFDQMARGIRAQLRSPDLVAVLAATTNEIGQVATRLNADAAAAGDPIRYMAYGLSPTTRNIGLLRRSDRTTRDAPRVELLSGAHVGGDARLTNPNGSSQPLHAVPPLIADVVVHFDDGRELPLTLLAAIATSAANAGDATAGTRGWTTVGAEVRALRHAQAVDLAERVQAMQQADPARRILLLGDFGGIAGNDGNVDVVGTLAGQPSPDATTLVDGDGAVVTDPPLLVATHLLPAEERYSEIAAYMPQAATHMLLGNGLHDAEDVVGLDYAFARVTADFILPIEQPSALGSAFRHDPAVLRIRLAAVEYADLEVAAVASPVAVAVGDGMAWSASVTNLGPEAAASPGIGFAVDAVVPDFAVVAPAGWDCDAAVIGDASSSIACASEDMADGGATAFAVSGTAPLAAAGRLLTLTAAATSQTEDPQPANDWAAAPVAVEAVADVYAHVFGPDTFRKGTVTRYLVGTGVLDGATGRDVALRIAADVFAADVSLQFAAASGWTCVPATGAGRFFVVDCRTANGDLSSAYDVIWVDVAATARGQAASFTLSTSITSDSVDPVSANDSGSTSARLVR